VCHVVEDRAEQVIASHPIVELVERDAPRPDGLQQPVTAGYFVTDTSISGVVQHD
jgi:hypothetical protein